MHKEMKENQRYFIINIKEPYAKAIYEVLKAGQIAKNEWPEGDISFEEWIAQTWPPSSYCTNCAHLRDSCIMSSDRVHCKLINMPLKQDEETKEYFKDPECIEQNLYISLDDFLKQIDRD